MERESVLRTGSVTDKDGSYLTGVFVDRGGMSKTDTSPRSWSGL